MRYEVSLVKFDVGLELIDGKDLVKFLGKIFEFSLRGGLRPSSDTFHIARYL